MSKKASEYINLNYHEYMTLIDFPERNIIFAKDQPEYRPLPAHAVPRDPAGRIICCWRLSWRARLRLLFTGKLWHTILTFHSPLQPQLLTIDKPEMARDIQPSEPWPQR